MRKKKHTDKASEKLPEGFLYLFVALARRATKNNANLAVLQHLSGFIETEISELKVDEKRKLSKRMKS